jgi:hypothetical protein
MNTATVDSLTVGLRRSNWMEEVKMFQSNASATCGVLAATGLSDAFTTASSRPAFRLYGLVTMKTTDSSPANDQAKARLQSRLWPLCWTAC